MASESFDELFPPSLSNQGDAVTIAKRSWKSLKAEGLLEEHAKAFQKFVDQGVFSQMSEKEMRDWDEQGKGSNFVTIRKTSMMTPMRFGKHLHSFLVLC